MSDNTDLLLVVSNQPDTAKFLSLSSGVTHPLGIAYLAAFLIKHGFNVKILDNNIERMDKKQFGNYLKKITPRYVGFGTFTNSFRNSLEFAAIVKEWDSKIKVIFGGAHVSALTKEVLSYHAVDIVVKKEGEETLLDLLRTIDSKGDLANVKGIAYKDGERIVENPDRELYPEIDKLPFPAYELLPMDKYYLPASRRMGRGRIGTIITGRGCPYRCTFCSRSVFGRGVRLRSPQNVVAEMKYLVDRYHIQEFLVWDDVFTIDDKRAIEICHLIKKNNLDIVWSCSSRVDRVSEILYKELYSSGCREVLLGVESGSQIILDSLQKDTTLHQVEGSVRLCKKYGMRAFCTFVIGSPFETRDTLIQTLNFVKKIDPHYALFCLLSPLPGSQLFNEAVSGGYIDAKRANWDDFISVLSAAPPPIKISSLSKEELVRWQKKLFREFYLRPRYILRHLSSLNSAGHIYESARGFLALMGHQFHRMNYCKKGPE